jgi:long-chain acyl-CoA synthetase
VRTLIDLFQTFPRQGERTAFIHRTGVRRFITTYAQLYESALRCASLLERRGVKPGDRVILWGPNSPAWAIAFWGILARGAVAVPVDFMSGRERAETITALTRSTLVFQSRLKEDLSGSAPTTLFLEDLPFALASLPPAAGPAPAEPATLAQLIYTSGTTGNPKGVMLTHGNLAANIRQVNEHVPVIGPEYAFLSVLPLSHMFEQIGGLLIPASHGAAVVHLRTIKPSALMAAFHEEDIRAMVLVPRLLQMLKSSIERKLAAHGLDRLFSRFLAATAGLPAPFRRALYSPIQRSFGRNFTFFVSGGAPLDANLARFWGGMGFRVLEGYGLTECSPVLTAATFDRQAPGSVGLPLPGVEIRLEKGEVQARGPNIFSGYFENPVATADAFTLDGWFRTGDLGELDADGWLKIKGRSKELIVTGAGVNVYPDEIEALLAGIPGVREACVIGLDRGEGESVHAVIIPDGSGRRPDEIIAEVNTKLDPLSAVTGISIWPETEFPKTTTLKVQKFKVRERLGTAEESAGVSPVADQLVTLVARIVGCRTDEVGEESFLVADLGLTSIARLELVTGIEQEFRLDLEDTLIGPQTRVADLRELIRKREQIAGPRRRLRFWTNSAPVRLFRQLCDFCLNYPVFRLFVRLEIRGAEHLDGIDGPVFFIANHLSYLDQPSIMFALPRARRYRTASAAWAEFFFENFHNPWQHAWKRLTYEYGTLGLNLFPLPQSSGFRPSLAYMGKLADAGISILLFPEGERSISGRMLPFRPGVGLMAKELGLPVVPVGIRGVENVLPRGGSFPKRGTVTVIFGQPLRFTTETPEMIIMRTEEAVAALCSACE